MVYLVQPYNDGPDRFEQTTIVSSHATAAQAFAALKKVAEQLHAQGIAAEAIPLFVVDEQRRLVHIES